MSIPMETVDSEDAIGALLNASKKQSNQLHSARYYVHKLVTKKYGDALVQDIIDLDQARELYRLAMENYDQIIAEAPEGHCYEANEASMKEGFKI